MRCKQCGGRGRYRVIKATGSEEHYCYCSAGDVARARDVEIGQLAPNTPRPIVKARVRPKAKPRKARPRVAAKAPKRRART